MTAITRGMTIALIASAACAAPTVLAQTAATTAGAAFPSQQLEIVAHTAAGGGTDQFVRLMAEIFTREKIVSQPPVISNRVGGRRCYCV